MDFREKATKFKAEIKANWVVYFLMALLIGFALWQVGHPVVKTFYEWKLNALEAERAVLKKDLEEARSKLQNITKTDPANEKIHAPDSKLPSSKEAGVKTVPPKVRQVTQSGKATAGETVRSTIESSVADNARIPSICDAYIAAGSRIQSAVFAVVKGSSTEKSVFSAANAALSKLRADLLQHDLKPEASVPVAELEGVWDALAEIDTKTLRFCEKRQTNFLSSITKAVDDHSKLQCAKLKTVSLNLLGLKEQADAETMFTDKSHLVTLFNGMLAESKSIFPNDVFIQSFPKAQVHHWHFDTRRLLLVSTDSLRTRLEGHSTECTSSLIDSTK